MDFDGRRLTHLLEGKVIGKRVHFLQEVDSTNNRAAELARGGSEEGEVVVAERQVKGKGRLNRVWQSPTGVNLYTTIILRPSISPAVSPQITLTAGVAVAETLSLYCGKDVTLKWPNDVQVRGKKICGILTEMRLSGTEIDFVVVGIGININIRREDFDEAFRDEATSLREELGREVSRADIAVQLFSHFEKWYHIFIREGFPPVREAWLGFAGILGREIRVVSGSREDRGRVLGMDDQGALLIGNDNNETKRVIAGDVFLMEE